MNNKKKLSFTAAFPFIQNNFLNFEQQINRFTSEVLYKRDFTFAAHEFYASF